jgi:hypothetical protein
MSKPDTCPDCGGRGFASYYYMYDGDTRCPTCHGTGHTPDEARPSYTLGTTVFNSKSVPTKFLIDRIVLDEATLSKTETVDAPSTPESDELMELLQRYGKEYIAVEEAHAAITRLMTAEVERELQDIIGRGFKAYKRQFQDPAMDSFSQTQCESRELHERLAELTKYRSE